MLDRRVQTVSRYVAYKVTSEEMLYLGGFNLCDSCSKSIDSGYYIPVLNQYFCKECFNRWDNSAHYYPQDRSIERKRTSYFEAVIGIAE